LQVDYELLRRVLQHFIHNAIKFTDEGCVAVRTTLDDTHVRIHVEDTGCGISPAFRPRLFDAFAQESEGTTRTHQGSGLGLTVSQRLTERMGGAIEVASTPDEGSTFTLVFPRADA
jgi:signal transduction histidine kinase